MFSSGIGPRGSFKRQIVLTFVVGFFLLVSGFAVYIVKSESGYRFRDKRDATIGLAQSLAVSSLPGVLANDVSGLQEVVQSFQNYPELRYAMVISPAGRVLGHTDANKVGLFLADDASTALVKSPPGNRVITDDAFLIDVAVPIEIDRRFAGWARIGLWQGKISGELRKIAWSIALFTLLATCLSLAAAFLIASRLGRRIGILVNLADKVQAGDFASRASVPGAEDEIVRLAGSLNKMLDVLAQNETRLRTVSHYTRSLIEASLDPFVMINVEGKITDVNSAAEAATGCYRSELIGTDFSNYFTEPDRARAAYEQVFAKGSVTDYALALRHRDGHVTGVLYNASVYRDEAGEVLGVFAAARDVTERKKAELELTQLSLRHRLILDSAGEGIYGLDLNGRCTFVNPAALELLGFTAAELVGQFAHSLFHHTKPDGSPYPEEECPIQAARERGATYRVTDLFWRKDGSSFPVDVVSTPIVEAGKITGAVVAFSDITERRRAGERVALLTLALNNVHEAAYLIGEDGGFLYVNEGACRALGYTSYELLQMHVPDIDPGMPAERWPDHWRELKAKSTLTFEGYHKAKDGQVFPIEINANHFESGGRSYNLALVRDITERKRAEEELRRYKDQLEETVQQRTSELLLARDAAEAANKAKSVFLANISHELRTPLNAILGFSSLMRREPDVSPNQQERLDIINRSGEYLLTLINDVLEMAKIEAGPAAA